MDKKNNNDVLASLGDQVTDGGGLKPAADRSLGDQATFLGEASSLEAVDDGLEVVDLASRYKVERTLGRGGMGEVSLATDTRLNRKVAIKRILGTASNNPTAVSRFLNEAQAVAALNHPNIVHIYDYGRAADGPFLIMEHVDGSSLLDRCRAGALTVEEAVELTCQICDGLSRAHEHGIIHRDIKPANILVTRDGVPKLTDFGLAKVETADTGMTMAGAVLGTLDFMPPEQRRNASLVDARSDLWSLAATLYQMLTGRVPTVIKLNDVPRSLQDVLSKALEDAQEDRYQTAKDFKAALRSSLSQASMSAIDLEGALGSGECPQCHVKNDPTRKFCNGCGTSLRVSCLECSKEMPVWEKFCGDCGASKEESLRTRLAALAAKSEEAEQQLADMNFAGARALAHEILGVTDTRLQQLKPWVDKFLDRVDASFQDAINHAQLRLGESLTHEAAFDYRLGIKALENVPDFLRTEILPNAQASIETVLSRLKNKLKRTEELSRTIRQRVQARQLSGLLADVQELSVLAPQRPDVVKLKDQLLQREAKLKQARQEALIEAEQHRINFNCKAAIQTLERVPSPSRTIEISNLLQAYKKEYRDRKNPTEWPIVTNSIGIQLKRLFAGVFTMGEDDEAHQVTLTKSFHLGVYEVTQEQYEKVMGNNPSKFKDPRNPVETVNWHDAVEFCKKLSELPEEKAAGRVYRLPTEAEWEYACRAGSTTRYSFGDDEGQLGDHAWFSDNSNQKTHPVGQKKPNAWGLYDMHGNVWEWCSDWRDKYPKGAVSDPAGPSEVVDHVDLVNRGDGSLFISRVNDPVMFVGGKVDRGGSWDSRATSCRSSSRNGPSPASPSCTYGFRVALSSSGITEPSSPSKRDSTNNIESLPPRKVVPRSQEPTLPALDNAVDETVPPKLEVKLHDPAASAPKTVADISLTKPLLTNSIGMRLAQIPAGAFTMGEGGDAHRVTLTKPFHLGVYEVTQEEYQQVMSTNPSRFKDTQNPVVGVSWEDAVEFCKRLSKLPEEKKAGRVYRLPTEAEWEYACRAGSKTKFSFGNDVGQLGDYAWFEVNSSSKAQRVGQKKPNAWGLYDMHGNVWEWCADRYSAYPKEAVTDPHGPAEGVDRVSRGGSCDNKAARCGSSNRSRRSPAHRSGYFGFRVALSSPSGIPQ